MSANLTVKKAIIVSLIAVVGIAAVAFGVLYFTHTIVFPPEQQAPAAPAPDVKPVTKVDLSKDYGACTILSESQVKQALGSAADTLQAPENNGVIGGKKVGEGMDNLKYDSQACVYAFIPGGTFENGYNSNNAFNIVVTKYTNDEGPATFIAAIRSDSLIEEVPELGKDAFYSSNTVAKGPGAMYSFKLQVFTDKTLVEYTIRQPAEGASFTADSAKAAMIALAKQVTLK